MPNTAVEKLGLREGDQLLKVNGINMENIDHANAVKILKANAQVTMLVRHFPYGYRKTYERVGAVPTPSAAATVNSLPDVIASSEYFGAHF